MQIDVISIFPNMFDGPFSDSIIQRAIKNKLASITIHNLRDFSQDKHNSVDDRPYGGGPGMVMMVEPIHRAVSSLKRKDSLVIAATAKGRLFKQGDAIQLSNYAHIIIICGHYEGIDQRVLDHIADIQISIGEYVLSGGEIPAMVIIDSVIRLVPGVLGDSQSLVEESHQINGKIEHPQYTRPDEYNTWKVPKVLLSGNHQNIKKWRQANTKTQIEVDLELKEDRS